MKVVLSPKEMIVAASMGILRQVENLKRGRTPAHGSGKASDWQLHVEGCLGEYAAAKALGVFPGGFARFRGADLECRLEVRTRSEDWHDLILHDGDDDDSRFVLLCGRNGEYEVVGWILGRDGKDPAYWKDPAGGRAAYFVPQGELESIQGALEPAHERHA